TTAVLGDGRTEPAPREEGHPRVERLVKLVADPDYQQLQKTGVKDLAVLHRHLQGALQSAAGDPDVRAVPLVVEAARALVVFREEELRPEPLFELARNGEMEAAVRRLDLFELDPEWRAVALLTIAWLAADARSDDARALR